MEFHHARHVSAFERPHRQHVQYKQVGGQLSGEVSSFDSGYQRSHESAPYNSLEQLMPNERLTPAASSSSYHLTRADSAPRSIYSYTMMARPERWSPGQPIQVTPTPPRHHHYSFGPDLTHGHVAPWPTQEYQWQLHPVDPIHGQAIPHPPPPGTRYVRIDPDHHHHHHHRRPEVMSTYNVVPAAAVMEPIQPTYYGSSTWSQAPPTVSQAPTTMDDRHPQIQRVVFVTPEEEEEDMGVVTDSRNIFESILGPEQYQQFCVPATTQSISPQPSPSTLQRRIADIATNAGFIPVQPGLSPSPMPTEAPSSDESVFPASSSSASSSSSFAVSSLAPSVTSSSAASSLLSPALSSAFTPVVSPPSSALFHHRTSFTPIVPPPQSSSSSLAIQSSFVSPPLSEAASQQLSITQVLQPPLASSAESVPSAFVAPPPTRGPTHHHTYTRLMPTTATINSAFVPIMAAAQPPLLVPMPKLQAALHDDVSTTTAAAYESEDDDVILVSVEPPPPAARRVAKKRAMNVSAATRDIVPLRHKLTKVKAEGNVATSNAAAVTNAEDSDDDDVIFVSVTYPNKPTATTTTTPSSSASSTPAAIRTKLKRSPSGNGMVIVHPSPVPSKKKKPNDHGVVHQRKQCPVKQSASAPVVPSVAALAAKKHQQQMQKSKSHVSTEEIAFFPNTDFHSKYMVLNEIGKGGGGTVYAGKRRSDGLEVAVKKIDMKTVKRWSQIKGQTVPIEFALYKKAANNNKGVVQPLDWFEYKKKYLLVMERTKNVMDLFDLMNCKGPLPEKSAKKIFRQVVNAVRVCHKNGVVHRDIKDENVLVNPETFEAKLIDFGCAARLKEADYLEFAGTPEFYPPEWFKCRRYNGRNLDTWSLGVLLYTMIESEVPFKERADICKCNLQFKRSTRSSSLCRKFIREMLDSDEKKRIRLEDIMSHPWMVAKD